MRVAEALASGFSLGSGALWETTDGRQAKELIDRIAAEGDFSGHFSLSEYQQLLEGELASENARARNDVRRDIMIWGTLEARVQGADLVILGGLNEGVWPGQPPADPWLNRTLREKAGLLKPERQIGLSAHDYQQAVSARSVILSRSKRDAGSETVPSRWLSRLTNLLEGLSEQGGDSALAEMRKRGDRILLLARQLNSPLETIPSAVRPAPAPPVHIRPKNFTVTEIGTLIRDPYAIYAKHVLGLLPVDPLLPTPDARLKGVVFHEIFERVFSPNSKFESPEDISDRFRFVAHEVLSTLPWKSVALSWVGHINSISDLIAEQEMKRRGLGQLIATEAKGQIQLAGTKFTIRGKADRIDRMSSGEMVIYDYKTGSVPSPKQILYFDRQLPIEALMAERGGFEELPSNRVSRVCHIGMGRKPVSREIPLEESDGGDLRVESVERELIALLTSFEDPSHGYSSKRATEALSYSGDYDHLARFGEWDETNAPVTELIK
jgi:RecB family exonuclease